MNRPVILQEQWLSLEDNIKGYIKHLENDNRAYTKACEILGDKFKQLEQTVIDLRKQNKDLAELAGLTERRHAFMEKKGKS